MKKYITWLVIFAIVEITLALGLTMWREHFWNAISNRESLQFMQQLGIFTCVALVICFVSGISGYLVSLSVIAWRKILNHKAMITPCRPVENLSQRIQEDCQSYPDLVLNLGFGTVKAVTYIVVFSISLMLSFSWWFLGILIAYSIIGTLVTRYIAYPLIHLNYEKQRVEAGYRSDLTINNFEDCLRVMLGLAKKQKHLTYFQQFYGQIGVVVPLLIIAPVYFTSGMTLGTLMRFNSLSSTVLDNMSFGISQFANINNLLSCRKRLKEANIL